MVDAGLDNGPGKNRARGPSWIAETIVPPEVIEFNKTDNRRHQATITRG